MACEFREFGPHMLKLASDYNELHFMKARPDGFMEVLPPSPERSPSYPGAWATVLVTPLMVRVHDACQQARYNIIFDGVHGTVRDGEVTQFTAFVPLPCGGLPVFHFVTNCKAKEHLQHTARLLATKMYEFEEKVGRRVFFGQRGAVDGPENFLTDMAEAEYGALQYVWSLALHWLCKFHVLKAVRIGHSRQQKSPTSLVQQWIHSHFSQLSFSSGST